MKMIMHQLDFKTAVNKGEGMSGETVFANRGSCLVVVYNNLLAIHASTTESALFRSKLVTVLLR